MDNNKTIAEEKLAEMKRREEKANRMLFRTEYVLMTVILICFFTMLYIGVEIYGDYPIFGIILCAVGGLSLIIGGFWSFKIEHDTGYYECPNCGEKYAASMKAVVLAPHFGTTRRLKCPHCRQRGFHKKVLSR